MRSHIEECLIKAKTTVEMQDRIKYSELVEILQQPRVINTIKYWAPCF